MGSFKRVCGGTSVAKNPNLAAKQPHQDFETCFNNFVAICRERIAGRYPKLNFDIQITKGAKYRGIIVINKDKIGLEGIAGFAFVENSTGFIFKANTATSPTTNKNKPGNGARGSIFDSENGATCVGGDGIVSSVNR